MTTRIQTIDTDQKRFTKLPPLLISFDLNQLRGVRHNSDVQTIVDQANAAIGQASTLFQEALTAIKQSTATNLLTQWMEMQTDGREITDRIKALNIQLGGLSGSSHEANNAVRAARLALNVAQGAELNKRPTEKELAKYSNGVEAATVAFAEAKQAESSLTEQRNALAGALHLAKEELSSFEAREDEIADQYNTLTGKKPGNRPGMQTAEERTELGLAQ